MRELSTYEEALPIALLRAREATLSRFRAHVKDKGLTLEQWRVLRALAEHQALEPAALCDLCVLLPPSLSRINRTLEEMGLVEIVVGQDRRKRTIQISAKGRDKFQEMEQQSAAIYQDIRDAYGTEKLQQLTKLLRELQDALT